LEQVTKITAWAAIAALLIVVLTGAARLLLVS